ncbi:MAG: two-component system sensor histidine kinase NtrB [Deltaproteobacteria bacterium]
MSATISMAPEASGISPPSSSDLLRAVVDHVGLPMFVKVRSFRVVLVNPALAELMRCSAQDLVGRTDYDFFPVEQADFFRSVDAQVFEHGQPVIVEEESLTDPAGTVHIFRTVKEPLRDPRSGEITHLVGIITDVTDAKQAVQTLRGANEELERHVRDRTRELENARAELLRKERLSVLGQLAASVAHQIRNPLAAIATASAILRRKLATDEDPDVAQALTAILEEVWGANRIITELLDYARLKAPVIESVSVLELVEQAIESAAPPEKILVERQLEPELFVLVDARQARDAIASVLRNACEAMPGGGRLVVAATGGEGEVLVAVEDSGPGLTREALKGLFEPLVTSKPLGLGLGLATARLLLENQRGSIRAATQRGGGARFEIRLPLAPATELR